MMPTENEMDNPRTVLEAVSVLARCEHLLPNLVEELLQPEFSDWARSLGTRPYDIQSLRTLLEKRLQEKVNREGLDHSAAALYLGMTEPSFAELLRQPGLQLRVHQIDSGENRFLKSELDSFADSYLPRFKTWSNRTTLLGEFFRNLQAQTGFTVEPQYCEIESCPRLADVVCANSECRPTGPPRKVCVAHRELLRDRTEKSLCEICVRRVLYGDLQGQFRIGGTEQRLKRDHPQ